MPEWKSFIVSVGEAQKCLGGISRTTFYTTVLPRLEAVARRMDKAATIKLGARRMVYKDVLHRFIEEQGQPHSSCKRL